MDEQRLNEIRQRAEAATPGPWCRSKFYSYNIVTPVNQIVIRSGATANTDRFNVVAESANGANTEFIAAARQDVPDLVRALEEAHRRIAELEANL